MPNPYDRIFKENMERILLRLSGKHLGFVIAKKENINPKLQSTVEREHDFLAKVTTDKGEVFILHVEFQTSNESDMVYRTAEYHGILAAKYMLPVRHYVLYMGAHKATMPSRLPTNEVYTGFTLLDIHHTPVSEFLSSDIPEEIVLGVLADFGDEPERVVLRSIVERLRQTSPHPNTLRKHLKQVLVLSRIPKLTEPFTQTVNAMPINIDISQDYLYLKGIEQGIEKGIEQGIEKGIGEGENRRAVMAAENCLKKGLDVESASDISGLPLGEVKKIAKKLGKV